MINYVVVENNQDELGYGDRLHEHWTTGWDDAQDYLAKHPRCTGIDAYDDEKREWDYDLTEPIMR